MIASMVVGNIILLVLNLPLIPIWVAVLKISYATLFAQILGPMMEKALRQSLQMSGGGLSVFYARPLTAALLALAIVVLVANTVPAFSRVKADAEI